MLKILLFLVLFSHSFSLPANYVLKFGEASDIDAADGFLPLWSVKSSYVFMDTAIISLISSDNAADTTQTILIQGLDSNYNEITQTATLSGQTPDTLATPLIRAYRMINQGSTSLVGTARLYPDTATIASGAPTLISNTKAQIVNGNNQTLMCIYTVPADYVEANLWSWSVTMSKQTASSVAILRLKVREFGKVFAIKDVGTVSSTASSHFVQDLKFPIKLKPKSDILIEADVSANDTGLGCDFAVELIK